MKSNRILLTGVNGQVGHALLSTLSNFTVIGLSRHELDLTHPEAIRQTIRQLKPDLIINPAAYTAVDQAETDSALAIAINTVAPKVIAEEASKIGAALIHFSTDYVYEGTKLSPYTEVDAVNPQSVYGRSKYDGEMAITAVGLPHLILRTSWVYGAYGHNFLKTILRLAAQRDQLHIVADQHGAPTSSMSIAIALAQLIAEWDGKRSGIYHLTNTGSTTWYAFAREIVRQYIAMQLQPALKVTEIKAITTADYPTPASRPANSCLDNRQLAQDFGISLPSWQEGLQAEMKLLSLQ